MTQQSFDVVIIGAGPGGYVAAICAAQLGKSVCLIEKNALGGTCLNVGCIPTKTLLAGAHVYHTVKEAEAFGIATGPVSFDFQKMKARKDNVVAHIQKGLTGLLQSNKITILQGHASFLSPQEIKVKGEQNLIVRADKVIIATGSAPLAIPSLPCDHKRIFDSTSILEQTTLPKTLCIIGGGYIGCEFASLYAELGVKVILLEALPTILQAQGKAVSETLTRAFTKKGIEIHTGVFVEGIDTGAEGLHVRLKEKTPLACDAALIAIGRKIVSDQLDLPKAGVLTDPKGAIMVNEKMETNVPGIYAIGDVTGKFLLAHVASHQAIVAARCALGLEAKMDYRSVPAVIFTFPEVATVGLTLEQAQAAGRSVSVGKFPFQALGKAVATRETEGFAQIIVDSASGEILGAQVIGQDASNLIAEMALAMNHELTLECVADTIHAHPTMAEAWLEAALIAKDTPIHFPKSKRPS